MVWYGMVWYGRVWYGMVWYAMSRLVALWPAHQLEELAGLAGRLHPRHQLRQRHDLLVDLEDPRSSQNKLEITVFAGSLFQGLWSGWGEDRDNQQNLAKNDYNTDGDEDEDAGEEHNGYGNDDDDEDDDDDDDDEPEESVEVCRSQ